MVPYSFPLASPVFPDNNSLRPLIETCSGQQQRWLGAFIISPSDSSSWYERSSEDVFEVLDAIGLEEDQDDEGPKAQDEAVWWVPVLLLGFLDRGGER